MSDRKKRGTAGDKTICLPIAEGLDYEQLVKDTAGFSASLDRQIAEPPELFPARIGAGYCLHGLVHSDRLGSTTRRIRLKCNRESYQIRPDSVLPYMVGSTEAVEQGLSLRRYGVPYAGIAPVLGHAAMYWYRATQAMGRAAVVGSTVKAPAAMPPSLGGR